MQAINKNQPFESTPSVLSLSRVSVISDALFYASFDTHEEALNVVRHGIRGTQNINNDKKVEVANVQLTDAAKLPANADALIVRFSIRFLPLHECINAVIDSEYRKSLVDFIERSKSSDGIKEVARRYARNILNGRWLWRNRTIAQSIDIAVESRDMEFSVVQDALASSLSNFDDYTDAEIALGEKLAESLRGGNSATFHVKATVRFGTTLPVELYPSQNYVPGKPKKGPAKLLYYVGQAERASSADTENNQFKAITTLGQAAIRDQKVGNAIRTIDTWYPDFETYGRPIAVEPKGANLDSGSFFRFEASAFELARRLHLLDPNTDDGMFMIASLVRGGVYSSKEEEASTKKSAKKKAKTTEKSKAEAQ